MDIPSLKVANFIKTLLKNFKEQPYSLQILFSSKKDSGALNGIYTGVTTTITTKKLERSDMKRIIHKKYWNDSKKSVI